MSAEAFQNIKENIELIPDEKKADEALYKKRLEICTECDCLINGMCSKCGCFVEMRQLMLSTDVRTKRELSGKKRKEKCYG